MLEERDEINMKWKVDDLEQYVQAKEFIDTLLIPLIPYQLANDSKLGGQAFQGEVLSIFSREIERELTGRVLLTPTYFYLPKSNKELEVNRLNEWVVDAKEQPFEYVMFLTFDSEWKKHEQSLNGELLSFLGMRTGDLHSKEIKAMIRDQVGQIVELIRENWET